MNLTRNPLRSHTRTKRRLRVADTRPRTLARVRLTGHGGAAVRPEWPPAGLHVANGRRKHASPSPSQHSTAQGDVIHVRKQGEIEAWTRMGFILIGHGFDSLGGFIIMREA